MARTPLLASLRSLARESRQARRAGLPLADWRAAGAHRPTRRTVLAGAAAGLAGLAAGCAGLGGARRPRARIAVVGGGLAGLCAAFELKQAGLSCTLFESSSRLGGRVFSNAAHWEGGQVSEGGGEFIDSGHAYMRALAGSFKLRLLDAKEAPPAGVPATVHLGGRYVAWEELERQFQGLLPALDADHAAVADLAWDASAEAGRTLDALSVHDWIARRVPGGHASELGALLEVAYASEFGADTGDQSAVNLLWMLGDQPDPARFEVFGPSDERFRVEGGNQRLCEALAREVDGTAEVHTEERLEALWPAADGSLRLALADGASVRDQAFDFAVLTLPFAKLRQLDLLSAGFDDLQRRLVDELGRGRSTKLQLQLAQRPSTWGGPWPGVAGGASFHDGAYQVGWDSARGQPGAQSLICLYTGGSLALRTDARAAFGTQSTPGVASDSRRGLSALETVLPGSESAWNGRATLSAPFRSEHLGLAYSYYRVGQVQAFSGREAAPQGPDGTILLAGEHTSVDFQGFMEGAAASGRDAARRIAERVGARRG